MLNKIIKKLARTSNHELVNSFLIQLEDLRQKSDELVLFGRPTEGNWLGIANATKGLYPAYSVEVPQSYSNCVFNLNEQENACKKIKDLKFKKLIISGFAPYFFSWIDRLYQEVDIEIIYHGTISEWHDPMQQEFISKLIDYGQAKKIKRIACVSKGLEEVFKKLYAIDSFHQPLALPKIPEGINKLSLDSTKIHIGVFGADTFNKNLHNQLVAALMIDNTLVHVLDASRFSYLNMNERIIGHGTHLPREQFLSLLASMDLNMYMSFNESWGLVAFESEALGVLTLNNNYIDYLNSILSKLDK